jgi:mono/diheme cytochrome c family protein
MGTIRISVRWSRKSRLLALAAVLPLAVPPSWAQSAIVRGEALVQANCAACHAIGPADISLHPDAPAFRKLSERYPIESLAEALAEGISTGHPDMPEFIATPDQVDAIIAYIGSLQRQW